MRIISLALIVLLAMTASAEMLEAVSNPGAIGIDVKEAAQNFFWNDETLVTAQSPSEKYGKQLRRRECRLRGWS